MQILTTRPPPKLSHKLPLTFDVWGFCAGFLRVFAPLRETQKNLVVTQAKQLIHSPLS